MGKISIAQRDVLLVHFPFFEKTSSKVRPAVVLSSTIFNSQAQEIIVCSITSKKPQDIFNVPIQNLTTLSLDKQSYIRAQNITKVHKSRIVKYLGYISEEELSKTKKALFAILKE